MALVRVVGIEEIELVNIYLQCFLISVSSNFIMMLRLRMLWWPR